MSDEETVLGVVVVGVGYLGAQRAAAANRARGCRLAGVVDRDATLARASARRHNAKAYSDLQSALSDPHVRLVVVATPHVDHPETVAAALDAGKHVLCEKPLAIDPETARELARRADHKRVRLGTGFNHRFYPPVHDAFGLLSKWAIGRVESLRVEIGHKADDRFLRGWHTNAEVSGGGTWIDNGPHACDLVRRCVGEVAAGQGYCRQTRELPDRCESEVFALFRNHDRAIAEVRSSWSLESGYLTIEIRGSAGHLRVETAPWRLTGILADGRRVRREYWFERARELMYRKRFGCERSLVWELDAFLSSDPLRRRAAATGWDGVRAAEMVSAIYRSAVSGSEVTLTAQRARAVLEEIGAQ
jgi:predicted dehydrogenase